MDNVNEMTKREIRLNTYVIGFRTGEPIMHTDGTNRWWDSANDIFIDLKDGMYNVSERLAGNKHTQYASFKTLEEAFHLTFRLGHGNALESISWK